ncbi:MAG: hypothetical protein A2Y62_07850 [Candidatus Fischerbacteria bacterium RBG_13_37_8]|uniref:Major facilitator superfamily (MFS) profile domain-containing protein n=1 Tax=Candidatus Fischerbacteria bacterium RBG_13_37_8 TaxID=1817863 RepID=A0A1F5V9H1_9BACT|nr:MAG: hypothetical protein A2Y62_07850 [Candidatus Fischerbacteria bacterium RBG_13_37_8]
MKSKFSFETYKKLAVIGVLYIAEGLPYGFLFLTLSVYFRSYGIELKQIGLISLMGLPWSFKALWSPIVDKYGQRWHWIVATQLLLALGIIIFANIPIATLPVFIWIILLFISFAGATQDIAVDAYSIDILESHEQGVANGVRTAFYRVAVIISGGGLIAVSSLIEWKYSFYFIAALFIFIALVISLNKDFHQPKIIKKVEQQKSNFLMLWYYPLKELLVRKDAIPVMIFILLFKFGDQMMTQMVYPFWYDNGFTREEIGLISGTLGMLLTIIGALLGGYLTSKWDIATALWILGAFQAFSNLGYAAASHFGALTYQVYSASMFESFSSGLGTAAFLAFLMRLCKKQYSATQYALLSSIFVIGARLSGALGGYCAQYFGYTNFFIITFFVSLPAFALLPFVMRNLKTLAGE